MTKEGGTRRLEKIHNVEAVNGMFIDLYNGKYVHGTTKNFKPADVRTGRPIESHIFWRLRILHGHPYGTARKRVSNLQSVCGSICSIS